MPPIRRASRRTSSNIPTEPSPPLAPSTASQRVPADPRAELRAIRRRVKRDGAVPSPRGSLRLHAPVPRPGEGRGAIRTIRHPQPAELADLDRQDRARWQPTPASASIRRSCCRRFTSPVSRSRRSSSECGPTSRAGRDARGMTGDPRYAANQLDRGSAYAYHADARFDGARGTATRIETRPCTLTFVK